MRDPLSHHGGGVCGINDMLGIGGDHRRRGTFHKRALGADQDTSLVSSLPFIGLLSTTLALGLVKLTAYSQLEVVRTAMLSRHVKNGGAKVLQLGGTTRDLYYYPAKTLSVTVNVSDGGTRTRGLFEQAGASMFAVLFHVLTSLAFVQRLTVILDASRDDGGHSHDGNDRFP